jgi:hypothetical protein
MYMIKKSWHLTNNNNIFEWNENNGEKFKVYVLISFKSKLKYSKFGCKHDVHNSNS